MCGDCDAYADSWRETASTAQKEGTSHADFLASLVHREVVARHDRRVQRRIQDAKFPNLKTLDTLRFREAGRGSIETE